MYEFSLWTIAATIILLFCCCGVKFGGGGGRLGGNCRRCDDVQFGNENCVSSSTSGNWGILFEFCAVLGVSAFSISYWWELPRLIENQRDNLPWFAWFWGDVSPGSELSSDNLFVLPMPPLPLNLSHKVRALFNVLRNWPLLLNQWQIQNSMLKSINKL